MKPIQVISVPTEDLKTCNVARFVRRFSIDGADNRKLCDLVVLWNKCIITFPVEDDPREVTNIPEVRQFIQQIHRAMPYFPCYFDFRPEFGMFLVYFGCLAEPAALLRGDTGGTGLDLCHPTVLPSVLKSLFAIKQVACRLSFDPIPTWHAILAAYPAEITSSIVQKHERLEC